MGSRLLLLSALLAFASLSPGAEVAGVKLDDMERVGSADLVLNGAGLRTKFVFKVYAMGLYLAARTADAAAAIGATTTARRR